MVEAPTGAAIFPKEIRLMPRRWVERTYSLPRWRMMPSGRHFAPMEEPDRLVEDIRTLSAGCAADRTRDPEKDPDGSAVGDPDQV
jgi:hypothetical protein